MSYQLIILPNPILRKKAESVENIDKEIKKIAQEMKKIVKFHKGLGLAGNQIGILKRIFVINTEDKQLICLNPEILEFKGKPVLMEEGCLSVPGTWGEVKRYPEVLLEYLDLWGRKKKLKAGGLLAQVIQHEVDHLDGILFIDKAKQLYSEEEFRSIHKK